ncbi:MAG: DUF4105 domain-containing protein [Thermodesulfobacteriota bacterium]
MRWLPLAALLLLLSLAGCGLRQGAAPPEPFPLSLSQEQGQDLQAQLTGVPGPLAQAIGAEIQIRLASAEDSQAPGRAVPAKKILTELLSHSGQPLLQPGDEFAELRQLIDPGQAEPTAPFARALASYLLEPDFACRQPIFHAYFNRRYQKGEQSVCSEKIPLLLASRLEGVSPIWLDPGQEIREVHLLFAGQGEKMASRFGHVALRLLVCPAGKDDADSCASNLYNHIVLGFMAHVDEFELNTIKALSGDYAAHLFALPFMDAYRGYAIEEFRELHSVPLKLNSEQRQLFVRQLSEIHWRFAGDYNFFSRNCATLLQDVLRALLPGYKDEKRLKKNFRRPDTFFAAIRQTPLVAGKKLVPPERAEEEGYYFASTKPFYAKALAVVAGAMSKAPFRDLNSYLARPPSQRLAAILADPAYVELLSRDPYQLEAQLLLEELALTRSERRLQAQGSRYLHDFDFTADQLQQARLSQQERLFFNDCFLAPIRQFTSPVPRLPAIPAETTQLPALAPKPDCQAQRGGGVQLTDILGRVNAEGQEQWLRVLAATQIHNETMKNIITLQELRHEPL